MKIILDMQSCQSGSRKGGIGRYSLELAKAMARRAGRHELWMVLSGTMPEAVAEVRAEFSDLLRQDRIRVFDAPPAVAELNNNKTKVRSAELVRENFINSLRPDFIHISSLFEGLQEDVITSVGALGNSDITSVTLYDLIPLVQRDRYLVNKAALTHYLGKIENLKKAGLLLSISDFSRSEAIEVLGIDADKIVNISSAADEKFKPLNIDPQSEFRILNKYGIRRKFLMYTGSFDQRKNQGKLIEAYGRLPPAIRKKYQLVIVGNGWDAIYQSLREVASKSGLAEDELVFAGHVSDEDLLPLYNLCHLFVFPSLAEGFGLPILEAMSCGTPAIGSNCTSIPEVIGWSDALFDPKSVESISAKINQVLTDDGFYTRLVEHGLQQSKKFSWDESARISLQAFEDHRSRLNRPVSVPVGNVVESISKLDGIEKLPDGALLEMAQSIAANQVQIESIQTVERGEISALKVGWVSTWNTRCGIAAYSDFLIRDFPCHVTVFAPDADELVRPDESNIVRCWKQGVPDDLQRLFSAVKRAAVDVIIIQFNYGFYEFPSLASFVQLAKFNDIKVYITFHSTFDPSDSKRLLSLQGVFALCDGLIAHSMGDIRTLRKIGLTHNLHFLPQGVVENIAAKEVRLPQLLKKKVIATYGFALPSKGLKETLEAFAEICSKNGNDYHFLMMNAEYPDPISAKFLKEIRLRIKELGLDDRVTLITEYLSDESCLGYLAQADLIVYSYQKTGESSSAAVRMGLAARRPVAVTPVSIFDDVRAAVFTFKGREVSDIANGIVEVFKDIESSSVKFQSIKESARLWVAAHGYASIARQLFWIFSETKSTPINYSLLPSFTLTQESVESSYSVDDPSIRTGVGMNVSGAVRSSGKDGVLVFGPFISVAPGRYAAVIYGDIGAGGAGHANADVAIKSGSSILAKTLIISADSAGIVAKMLFTIPEEGCTDLEVRVWVGDRSDIGVSKINLMPLEKISE